MVAETRLNPISALPLSLANSLFCTLMFRCRVSQILLTQRGNKKCKELTGPEIFLRHVLNSALSQIQVSFFLINAD